MRPDSITVAGTWIRSLPDVPASKVNTTLPAVDQWVDTGFIQVYGVVGGTPHLDAPIHQPVVQVDAWAARLNSERPPWDKASALMDLVVGQCTGPERNSIMKDLVIGSNTVRVLWVYPISEPRKPPQGLDTGDPASFARLTVDLQFAWTILS